MRQEQVRMEADILSDSNASGLHFFQRMQLAAEMAYYLSVS